MPPIEPTRLPRLFLIRHGDTEWTDSHRHTGLTDIPLTPRGEERGRELGARLQGETFTRVFTSPLVRARRTCELVGYAGHADVNPDLVEWDYGDYEGLASVEIKRNRLDWNLFRDGVPHGESPEQVAARADRFLDTVRPMDGDVAAFSSGHIIRMIAARWLGMPPLAAKFFYSATASVGILGYEHTRNEPVVLLWNDIRPLAEKG
jgi:probable phosphoglycerate mutase